MIPRRSRLSRNGQHLEMWLELGPSWDWYAITRDLLIISPIFGFLLTTLQKKGKRFEWTINYATSFNKLKMLLTNAPVLRITYPKKDFILCIDACKEVLGGVLIQEGQVVCYELRKLNEHEQNYLTHELEFVASYTL